MHHTRQRERNRTRKSFSAELQQLGIRITVVFAGFEGESYADIPTVARTVGLVPPDTREARLQELREISNFARQLGVDAVGLHIGSVPHDAADPLYAPVLAAARQMCDHCKTNGQNLHLETGQESADTLLRFLGDVDRDNLFVNFDPANMILYGMGDPIEALRKIGRYVRSVHCKDAKYAARPGQDWGAEVPLGDGDVGMERFLRTLQEIGYVGPLTIEREIPQERDRQREEIGRGIRLLKEIMARL